MEDKLCMFDYNSCYFLDKLIIRICWKWGLNWKGDVRLFFIEYYVLLIFINVFKVVKGLKCWLFVYF